MGRSASKRVMARTAEVSEPSQSDRALVTNCSLSWFGTDGVACSTVLAYLHNRSALPVTRMNLPFSSRLT